MPVKSRFITRLGWFAVVGSFVLLMGGGLQLAIYRAILENPDLSSAVEMGLKKQFGSQWPEFDIKGLLMRNGSSSVVFGVIGIVIGVALLRRMVWARIASIYFIALITAMMVFATLRSPVQIQSMLYWAGVALTVAAVFIHAGIIKKLSAPETKSEFQK
ncbi:MAG: hypothetical protein KGQ59_02835 [Bdellovibrionales bacterium]|nr:hypothetical protein [Bdellovibrionales bacterium]